ncbi:suppressor APC domain-containing protein 2-like [Homarus americanus]|uniref:Suppressor APC domain-containing protein 2-like n=1 Tax=Homarus americanus TaxID=6706 RepID=A0A8J5JKK0_HOMAM|nr:suppressor APC domain-containing protein 2-like [Homarus americanus]XP_042242632.1 suppressor APC domain-containing protein 2-like [Homarus americanus]XP_042242634.1 suppressor APC domain-containing protein 2-like [Homarus americanus]XP_042242635.1 suppressor APC domain-containing protein 2-like [Homarus americanus]KAG7157559.1 Suppressor APC domain-containing protein 2-like [Homarus americanus]
MTATQTNAGLTALDGLPKPFVNAMRTLFDIMDDQRSGFVKFSEIERRWQDDGAQGMPRGVLASLRKVTPPDGYLSFERFCAGLQISLLRNKMEDRPVSSSSSVMPPPVSCMGPPPPPPPHSRPPSAPLLDQEQHPKQPRATSTIPTAGLRPGMASSQHGRAERTMSMPHLDEPVSHHEPNSHHNYDPDPRLQSNKPDIKMGVGGIMTHSKSVGNMPGPPKPPRVMDRDRGTHSLDRNLENRSVGDHSRMTSDVRATHSLDRDRDRDRSERKWDYDRTEWTHRDRERSEHPEFRRERGSSLERLLDTDDKGSSVPLGRAGIRSALQTWHKERSRGDSGDNNNNNKNLHKKEFRESRITMSVEPVGRGVGDGGDSTRASVGTQSEAVAAAATATTQTTTTAAPSAAAPTHKKSSRRREPRRHTLQNGIDCSMLRRLKQLEAERDMLIQGYEVVERARNWYRQQLQAISERIHYLPQGPPKHEPSLEAQQEKLHFQLARIHEVNAHLQALMEATEHGLPSHMNLAISTTTGSHRSTGARGQGPEPEEQERVVGRLKDQNHLLTEEVSSKSERITVLEREKAALLREIFQSRPSHHHMQAASADSTFM